MTLLVLIAVGAAILTWSSLRFGVRPGAVDLLLSVLAGFCAVIAVGATYRATQRLPMHLAPWALGFREEGAKLLAWLIVFGRDFRRRMPPARRLNGLVAIAATFGLCEVAEHVSGNASSGLYAWAVLLRALIAPLHVWFSLCEVACLEFARGDRRWLAALPLPALLHDEFDSVAGLSGLGPQAQIFALALIIIVIGLVALWLSDRLVRPVRRSARSCGVGLACALIPVLVIAGQAGWLPGQGKLFPLRPSAAVAPITASWAVMALDLLRERRARAQWVGTAGA